METDAYTEDNQVPMLFKIEEPQIKVEEPGVTTESTEINKEEREIKKEELETSILVDDKQKAEAAYEFLGGELTGTVVGAITSAIQTGLEKGEDFSNIIKEDQENKEPLITESGADGEPMEQSTSHKNGEPEMANAERQEKTEEREPPEQTNDYETLYQTKEYKLVTPLEDVEPMRPPPRRPGADSGGDETQEQSHVKELQTSHQMVGRKSPENNTELKSTEAAEVDCDAEASTIESNSSIHGSEAAK
ncbi:unnamed protein product [Hymenolepis diminuta]|uniref:Uncharacterized protein n=1 Tax=Hymenolepis diminuta TaxID=6216 RepID=A0A564XXI3_HYMDI|nr:unnamed protein product [Hymenolepis diminuta]